MQINSPDDYWWMSSPWRAIPSANILFSNGKPVTWSIMCENSNIMPTQICLIASDLTEHVAKYIANQHNGVLALPEKKV